MNRRRAIALIDREMAAYRDARAADDVATAWAALEHAHIVSQPYLSPHLANHRAMLDFAFELRDWREVVGQIFRLLLAPLGSLTGRIPIGNTGRSNVSAFKAMSVPKDLLAKIESAPE